MEKAGILSILRKENTVFTFKDILLSSNETNPALLKRRIHYYVKNKELYPIRKGIYAKDKNYDRLELANKIYTPSYISLETVLSREGIVFQHYDQIFVVSYLTREITCDGQKYVFRKIKNRILSNSLGIEKKDNYFIASRERAFLDIIYLNKDYYFDNLSSIDWDRCFEMLSIYKNKAMEKRMNSYREMAKHA
ncbi:MAG: hypothetical protein JXB26_12950 [Candidatus Aminicenantes bacterium]|nr:hypothetical protein [Candidatus Aminicenantes bacterium]